MPVLSCLIVLLLIAALILFFKRKKEEKGDKKISGAVVSCALSIVLLGFSLIPAFIITGYKGLPTTGEYKIKQTSAILIDSSRKDPFEEDGSSREVPVHFYYPDCSDEQAEGKNFPLVVFAHGITRATPHSIWSLPVMVMW